MVFQALSGIGDKIKTIGTNLKQLTDYGLIGSAMASGLKPVYRITTSKTLSDGTITDRWLADSIPDWVLVKDVGKVVTRFDPTYVKELIEYKKEELMNNPDTHPEVIGILMDESPKNIYRSLVDIIFTNVPLENKDGTRKMTGEDFLLLGYPVRLTVGFIDVDGNFRKHPNEPAITTYGRIEPDFTGILGALTQETFTQGDFFQGTFVGFEYLLSRFSPQDPFPIVSGERLTRTLARMLQWLAVRSSEYITGPQRGATAGNATIAIPILRAMGVMNPNDNRILPIADIAKNINVIDMPRYGKRSRLSIPGNPAGVVSSQMPTMTYMEILKEVIEPLTNTEIFFNEYGRLTISGKPKVREIAKNSYDRIRVHDAVIGSNVIHHQTTVDLNQIVNRVVIHKIFSGINAGSPNMFIVHPNAGSIMDKDEVTKYYGHNEFFDTKHLYDYGNLNLSPQDPVDIEEQIIEYFRYYGVRGTVFMAGNPKIRVNDVIRVSDIRSFGIKGMNNPQSTFKLTSEAQYIIDNVNVSVPPPTEPSFRIRTGIDHFHVWKVVHYIGSDGFKTKVFYTKEQDSYIPGSDLLAQHVRRRRRGIEGDSP